MVWHFRFYGDFSEHWTKTEKAPFKDAALDSQNLFSAFFFWLIEQLIRINDTFKIIEMLVTMSESSVICVIVINV